jgi:small subunit ribosomal protein S17
MSENDQQAGATSPRGKAVTRVGTVVSTKCAKTISVRFDFSVKHPKYGKYVRRSTTLHADDPGGRGAMGDVVEVASCRPISKLKCWRLVRVVRSAQGV